MNPLVIIALLQLTYLCEDIGMDVAEAQSLIHHARGGI